MCGFVLIYRKINVTWSVQERLDLMDRAVAHRGPDEHGQRITGPVAMGHRRLSIIDLDGGKQPMTTADGKTWIVFNGEIYNYEDVKVELQALGHRFRENSDTEVLLTAWQQWGEDCLHRLNGMFAFALYNERNDELVLVRDWFGEKPIYYYETADAFYVASELKALMAAGIVEKRINSAALYSYLTVGYTTGEQSIFDGVRRLLPGSIMRWSPHMTKTRRWWRPPAMSEDFSDTGDVIAKTTELLRDSVRLRLVADVPVGCFLSGGVDSSAVVALATEITRGPVETFSIGFDNPRYDERAQARFVARRFKTNHHEFVLRPENLDVLQEIAWHADEPFADQAALPTWFLSKLTRRYATVALSGDGGDELFAGYNVYRSHGLSEHVRRVPRSLRELAVFGLRSSSYLGGDHEARLRLAKNIEDAALPEVERFVAKQQTIFRREFLEAAWRRHQFGDLEKLDREIFWPMFGHCAHPLGAIATWHQMVSLPDDMLHKVDRMSMAHSLEVRTPFLDHRLAELLNRTSFRSKLPGGRQKYILRKALSTYFPDDFLWQRKQGFNVPLSQWFKGDLSQFIRDRIMMPGSISRAIFKPPVLERILDEHARSIRSWDSALWALLMLEEWCKREGVLADSIAHLTKAAPEAIRLAS